MTLQRTALAIASILLLGPAPVPTAQGPAGDTGFVNMAIRVPASLSLPAGDSFPPIASWRSFVALEEMRLQLSFTNESQTPLWMYRSELRNAIQFRVDAEGTLPVTVRWLDEMIIAGEPLPVLVPAGEIVLLEPEASVVWTVAVRRADGQVFGPETYRITMDVRNARNALRDAKGELWSGRAPHDGPFRTVIRVELPMTAAESGVRYILEAEENASRDEFTAALNAFSRAAEVNPQDLSGMLGMAHMYRRLNRYREAITLYEKAFDASKRTDNVFARFLALAYVADGQDEKAIDALRNTGLPEAEILTRMQELRERVKVERLQPER